MPQLLRLSLESPIFAKSLRQQVLCNIVHIKADRDTLQIFMKCRAKRCSQWRASTHVVLNSRRITKRVAPSNPVFSRSFITSFGVDSYNQEQDAVNTSIPLLLFFTNNRPPSSVLARLPVPWPCQRSIFPSHQEKNLHFLLR